MFKRLMRRPSPSMAVALLALFVAMGGVAYSNTGGNFILGSPNTATSETLLTASGATTTNGLRVVNTSTASKSTAARFEAPVGHSPFTVNRSTKVPLLNADLLDGLDSPSFLRKGVAQTAAVTSAGGLLDVTNTGTTNGVQGRTGSATASGVYGENTSTGGFGVAGRAGSSGNAVYGDNTGTGYAGYFEDKVHIGGALDCVGCVDAADVTGKVSDSDKLDGIDSGGFVQGSGKAAGQALAEPLGAHFFLGPPLLGFLRLSYACPSTQGGTGFLHIYNDSGDVANTFVESGGANPSYAQLAAGDSLNNPASPTGDSWHVQAQGALGILTIEVASVHRTSDCHVQAQGLLTN